MYKISLRYVIHLNEYIMNRCRRRYPVLFFSLTQMNRIFWLTVKFGYRRLKCNYEADSLLIMKCWAAAMFPVAAQFQYLPQPAPRAGSGMALFPQSLSTSFLSVYLYSAVTLPIIHKNILIYVLFQDSASSSDYWASNGTMNGGQWMEQKWKEFIVA
jgi:hypothetical protein